MIKTSRSTIGPIRKADSYGSRNRNTELACISVFCMAKIRIQYQDSYFPILMVLCKYSGVSFELGGRWREELLQYLNSADTRQYTASTRILFGTRRVS